ncbi:MAG: hypothetical protein ACK5L5_05645 [Bacteroidales bacterium]
MRIKGIVMGLILVAMSVVAAYSQANYVFEKTVYICEDQHEPVNLVKSTGMQLSPNAGYWLRIVPSSHIDNSIPVNADIIEENCSSIFTVEGRASGKYEFIYVATAVQFCGINRDDFIRVVVDIQSGAKTISRFACGGELVNLSAILKSQNFPQTSIDSATWTVLNEQNEPLMPADKNLNTKAKTYNTAGREGQSIVFSYTVARDGLSCNDGFLILEVGEKSEHEFLPETISRLTCMGNIATPSNPNLNEIIGISQDIYNGKWTVISSSSPLINADYMNIDEQGTLSITAGTGQTFPQVGEYVFKYEYKKEFCMSGTVDTSTILTLTIKNDLIADFVGTDATFCENYGSVDLFSLINNISLPASSGTWDVFYNGAPVDEMMTPFDVDNGIFSTLRADVGNYTLKYYVSQSAQELCGLAGLNAEFTITISDAVEIVDAARQMCANTSETINLYNVFNEHINPNNWDVYYGGQIISRDDALAYNPSINSLQSNQSHVFTYKFIGSSVACGTDTANFFLTLHDEGLTLNNQKRYFCSYIGTDEINISDILGVVGVNGKWTVQSEVLSNLFTVDNRGNLIVPSSTTIVENTGLFFKGKKQYQEDLLSSGAVGDQTYVFTFTPSARNACIDENDLKPVTVTIIIGEDITQQF